MLISEANVPRRGNTVTRFSSARRLTASRTGVRPICSSSPSAVLVDRGARRGSAA